MGSTAQSVDRPMNYRALKREVRQLIAKQLRHQETSFLPSAFPDEDADRVVRAIEEIADMLDPEQLT